MQTKLTLNFSEIFTSLYDKGFPKFNIKLNQMIYLNTSITRCIKISSKRKEKFYENGSKKRNVIHGSACKSL